jgi:hypothetical protein
MPDWVKALLNDWLQATNLTAGKRFRRIKKNGKVLGWPSDKKAVWHVREYALITGIERLAPHYLRRTCARLCHGYGRRLKKVSSPRARLNPNDRAIPRLQAGTIAVEARIGI